jgi:5-formyltetrahydrofolate cyclo-ligase
MDKAQWRQRAAVERAAMPLNSDAHCRALTSFLDRAVEPNLRVVIYDAIAGEVDLRSLIEADADPQNRFAITRTPEEGFELTVHPYGCETERHRYGYRQPAPDAPVVADAEIGAVVVPGLAFDRAGQRLGRGKGYYDRFLARLVGPGSALLIGITGDYIVESLPTDDHDIPMTHLATSSGVHPVPVL